MEAVDRAGAVPLAPSRTDGAVGQTQGDDQAPAMADAWAALAHDVRATLGNIAWLAEIVGEEPAGREARAMASQIVALAHRTAEMMGDVLEYDRFAHEPARLRRAVSLRALLSHCADDAALQCRRRGLEFRFAVAARIKVTTDPWKMRRIVQNLLANAVRYTPRGRVTLSAVVVSGGVRISVRDTGIGVASTERDAIFRRYYRTAAARRMERLGSGIGLATVTRLCALLGATIDLQSEVGVGSDFTVTVPRR
jgi:signal transduction histidine kinase